MPMQMWSRRMKKSEDSLIEPGDNQPRKKSRWRMAQDHLVVDIKQALREANHNRVQYCLGCLSVYIVVVMVCLLLTAIAYTPVVFLTLSEVQAGEVDLQVSAGSWTTSDRVNYTQFALDVQGVTSLHTPRISAVPVFLYKASQCTLPHNSSTCGDGLRCLAARCGSSVNSSVYLIDSVRESQLGIGRQWKYGALLANTAYLHAAVAQTLRVGTGDLIMMAVEFTNLLPMTAWNIARAQNVTYRSDTYLQVALEVSQVLPSNLGKLPQATSNVIYMELGEVANLVADQLPTIYSNLTSHFREAAQHKEQYEQATNIMLVCAPYRVGCYLSSQFQDIKNVVVDWASRVLYAAGFTDLTYEMTLLSQLGKTSLFSAFLNLIFGLVIIILGGLSVFLIYSLLMVSVETKTFEMGIFRMVGMNRIGLVGLIVVQALMYAVPAWVLGLVTSQIIWSLGKSVLAQLINADVQPLLTPMSVGLATVLGLLVPIIAAILPIKAALTGNLHDALDTKRSKQKTVIITIERASSGELHTSLLITGLLLVIFGFGIYYFLPLALVYNNITLLFNIFLILLVGMLLGLVMLSLNLSPLLERAMIAVMFTLLWFENQSLGIIVTKNLVAHRLRNRKTSIMYALALGFIIFLTVAIRIEIQSLIYQSIQKFGGDIQVAASDIRDYNGVNIGILDVPSLIKYCESNYQVEAFALTSFTPSANSSYKSSALTNIGRTTTESVDVYATTPDTYSLLDSGYTIIASQDQRVSRLSLGERLYTTIGSYAMPMGTAYQSDLAIQSFDDTVLLELDYQDATGATKAKRTQFKPLTFVDTACFFTYSKFPGTMAQDAVMSFPTLTYLMNETFPSVRDIPIQYMTIKLLKNTTSSQLNTIIRELDNLLDVDAVNSLQDQLVGIIGAQSTLGYVFYIITALSMTVAFFSLNSSMYTNIMEQRKEIGVMRSLGITNIGLLRVFSYEAFVLIMSSALLGTMIGVVMGWSLAAQRSVVTGVPLGFAFPWDIFLLVAGISVVCAVVSTAGPVYQLVHRKQITNLMR